METESNEIPGFTFPRRRRGTQPVEEEEEEEEEEGASREIQALWKRSGGKV